VQVQVGEEQRLDNFKDSKPFVRVSFEKKDFAAKLPSAPIYHCFLGVGRHLCLLYI
jgi:hypothetical protein